MCEMLMVGPGTQGGLSGIHDPLLSDELQVGRGEVLGLLVP